MKQRASEWDATELLVPADILVFSEEELRAMERGRFYRTVMREAVWVYERERL